MIQQEASYLIEHGLAEPMWSSPCLVVLKFNDTPCFCNDYREVNSVKSIHFQSLYDGVLHLDREGSVNGNPHQAHTHTHKRFLLSELKYQFISSLWGWFCFLLLLLVLSTMWLCCCAEVTVIINVI